MKNVLNGKEHLHHKNVFGMEQKGVFLFSHVVISSELFKVVQYLLLLMVHVQELNLFLSLA